MILFSVISHTGRTAMNSQLIKNKVIITPKRNFQRLRLKWDTIMFA